MQFGTGSWTIATVQCNDRQLWVQQQYRIQSKLQAVLGTSVVQVKLAACCSNAGQLKAVLATATLQANWLQQQCKSIWLQQQCRALYTGSLSYSSSAVWLRAALATKQRNSVRKLGLQQPCEWLHQHWQYSSTAVWLQRCSAVSINQRLIGQSSYMVQSGLVARLCSSPLAATTRHYSWRQHWPLERYSATNIHWLQNLCAQSEMYLRQRQ